MGNNPEIVTTKRELGFLEGVFSSAVADVQVRVSLDVGCPHCSTSNKTSDSLEFGKIYEFTCDTCKQKFVLIIPNYQVRKGLIEEVLHGTKR